MKNVEIQPLQMPIANVTMMVQVWEQAMSPECMKLQQWPAKWNMVLNFIIRKKWGAFFAILKNEKEDHNFDILHNLKLQDMNFTHYTNATVTKDNFYHESMNI